MKYILLLAFLFTASAAFSQEDKLHVSVYNKYDFYNLKKNRVAVICNPVFYVQLFHEKKSSENYGEYEFTPFNFDTLTVKIEEKIHGDSVYYVPYGVVKLKLDPTEYYSVHKMYVYKDGTYMLSFYDDKNVFRAQDFIIVRN